MKINWGKFEVFCTQFMKLSDKSTAKLFFSNRLSVIDMNRISSILSGSIYGNPQKLYNSLELHEKGGRL